MVDITEISAVVAAAGVLIGVVYYILDMRNQAKTRTIDLALRLDATWENKDFAEWWVTFQERDEREYDTLSKENPRKWIPEKQILGFYLTLSFLVRKKLLDIEVACNLFPILHSWEKLQVYVEKTRRLHNTPEAYDGVEYLINEAKKRQHKLQQAGVKSA